MSARTRDERDEETEMAGRWPCVVVTVVVCRRDLAFGRTADVLIACAFLPLAAVVDVRVRRRDVKR